MMKRMRKQFSRIVGFLLIACFLLASANGYWVELQEMKKLRLTAMVDSIDDFGDTTDVVVIDKEEVPLSERPKITTKTRTKTKKYKLAKAVKKTKTTTKTNTKTKTKTKTTSDSKIVTETTVKTTVKTTLKGKTKTVKTTVKTTVKVTTTPLGGRTASNEGMEEVGVGNSSSVKKKDASKVDDLRGIVDNDIIEVFKALDFTVEVNSQEAKQKGYSGCFSPSRKKIILAKGDTATLIHELGHFVSFIKMNADDESDYLAIYNSERSQAEKFYRLPSYTTRANNEYFAESVSTFYMNGAALKSRCPRTYAYMAAMIESVSMEDAAAVKRVYGW